MKPTREFRRFTLDRKLDVKRLHAALREATREMAKDPTPEAAPARLESVLIEPTGTTVYISGNSAGLNAVASAVRSRFSAVKITNARRGDAKRMPRRQT
jgi:hypothetical protein